MRQFFLEYAGLNGKRTSSVKMVHTNGKLQSMLVRAKVIIEGYEFLQSNVIRILGENGKHEREKRRLEDQRVANLFIDLLICRLKESFLNDRRK